MFPFPDPSVENKELPCPVYSYIDKGGTFLYRQKKKRLVSRFLVELALDLLRAEDVDKGSLVHAADPL